MSNNYDPKRHHLYTPVNKDKYIGRKNPVCRSTWERDFCYLLDHDRRVVEWSSEALYIPYMLNGKRKHYYPDFYVKIKKPNGYEKWIVEIKPYIQTQPPKKGKNKSRKTKLNEKLTFDKNIAKWKAAKRFCKKMGYEFKIITEKQLYK